MKSTVNHNAGIWTYIAWYLQPRANGAAGNVDKFDHQAYYDSGME